MVAAPRWQNPSIELATIKALYNEKEIAFFIQWDDPFKDITYKSGEEFDPKDITQVGAYNSYVKANDMIPRQLDTLRDSIALQFPVKLPSGTKKPHFFRGDGSNPVNLWIWKADLDAQKKPSVEDAVARGWKNAPKVQAKDQQQVIAKASWDQGRWSVVLRRPLRTDDRNDVQFIKGKFIPIALNAGTGQTVSTD